MPYKSQVDRNAARGRVGQKKRAFTSWLKCRPCADCGGRFPPICMDFDHLPGAMKTGEIADLVIDGSWDRLLDELPKCEVVCSNCHRLRTASRQESCGTMEVD